MPMAYLADMARVAGMPFALICSILRSGVVAGSGEAAAPIAGEGERIPSWGWGPIGATILLQCSRVLVGWFLGITPQVADRACLSHV